MATPVETSSKDTWYHEKALRGKQFMLGGILFSLTGVGLTIGLPLILLGYHWYSKAPGPVRDVEIEE